MNKTLTASDSIDNYIEKEGITGYEDYSDEYAHSGEFLRAIVDELRQEYGVEVMRRKEALEELKGDL